MESSGNLIRCLWRRREPRGRIKKRKRKQHRKAAAGTISTQRDGEMAGAGQARLTAGGRNSMGTAVKSRVQARLFGPAVFESKKLQVVFMGAEEEQHPAHAPLPRMYTFTHSDVTAGLTLAIAHEFNKSQFMGWYSRLQRDEVLAVWRQHCSLADFRSPYLRDPWQEVHPEHACNGSDCHMSLHVHCHISGGHFLLNAIAALRFWIFRKELPVVLEAFRHGDRALFDKHPDLEDALVWVQTFRSTTGMNAGDICIQQP
ncbi:unnamed protein product, partial [Closterium sp. Naga37s-1]